MTRLQELRVAALLLAVFMLAGGAGDVAAIEFSSGQPAASKSYEAPAPPRDGHTASTPWHQVTGTVSNINRERGVVTLKARPATLRLSFPSEALRNLTEGDTITVQMAFSKVAADTGVRAYDAPEKPGITAPPIGNENLGYRRLTGMVRSIDHNKGLVALQSGGELFTLYFPATAIGDLEPGDTITVHMAFTKGNNLS